MGSKAMLSLESLELIIFKIISTREVGFNILTYYPLLGPESTCQMSVQLQVNLFQKLAASAEHVVYQNCSEYQNKTKTTICVHNMFCRYSELTIFMNNEQSVVILWVM